jgi:hypothetical protein
MTDALQAYRDDGPLATVLSRAGRQPAPLAATVAAGVVLTLGLAVDGATVGLLSIAGAAAAVVLAAVGQGRAASRVAWLIPALLRALEYATILYLGWRAGGAAPPAVFALLGAVAFHQYDVDHRLRTRGVPPPRTVGQVGLGWDGRLLLLSVAAALDAVPLVAVAVAVVIAGVSLAENALVWRHTPAGAGPAGASSLDAGDK